MGNNSEKLFLIIEFKFVAFSLQKCGPKLDFILWALFESYCLDKQKAVLVHLEFTPE